MALSDNAKTILNFLKTNADGSFTQNDIADATGVSRKAMTGTINGLVRKGFATRVEDDIEIVDGDKTKTKTVKYVKLTDAGMVVDPDTVE